MKPTFIVAEIGVNHNGDMKLAKDMILVQPRLNDSVKFQNYRTEDFVNDKDLMIKYVVEILLLKSRMTCSSAMNYPVAAC